jgi:serine/threonine-protein kinase
MINAERYRKIDEIFRAALELNPDERSSFISQASEGDESLLKEVEYLLVSDEQEWELINLSAFEMAAPLLATDQQELAAGERLGHYSIVSLLGAGGMGQVYLAEDTRLGRKVAIKLLPTGFTQDESRLRRFQQEARAASALNHPNILTIHDIWEIEGRRIIATEYVEGESLNHRIKQGNLCTEEVLDISIQVASALWAAHQAYIIHRDIKPQNIMVRRDGLVKVLDFGLAKLVENQAAAENAQRPTTTEHEINRQLSADDVKAEDSKRVDTDAGLMMGTLIYMSPEQVKGVRLDVRTDIFSLGVVMYEMFSGRLPFDGESNAELIRSILEYSPEPLFQDLSNEAGRLQSVVEKALRKDRDERYQSAAALLTDLKILRQELGIESRISSYALRRPTIGHRGLTIWTRRKVLIAGALLLIILCAGILYFLAAQRGENVLAARKSIAVMPFKAIGADEGDEYLRLGIAETLINKLGGLRQLIVRPLASVIRYGGQGQDPIAAGKELGVDVVLDGQIQRVGDRYRVTVQLWQVSDSESLSSYKCDEQCTSIFDLQDAISERVANVLVARLTAEEQQFLAKRYIENKEVYDLYLKGRFYWNKKTREDYERSIEFFNQAIKLDENYAPAYSGLADAYVQLAWSAESPDEFELTEKGKAAAIKAIEIDDNLAEAHTSLAFVKFYHDWDWPGAEKEFERAIALKPNYATAMQWYAYVLALVGQSDKAISLAKAALELDPISVTSNFDLGAIYIYTRHADEALEQLRKTLDLEPTRRETHNYLLYGYEQKGMYDELLEAYLKSRTNPEDIATIRNSYSASGYKGFCQYRLDSALKRTERGHVDPFVIASLFARVGDNDKAMEWLEKSYQAHKRMMVYIKADQRFDGLRSDPRFKELIRRVGLPE